MFGRNTGRDKKRRGQDGKKRQKVFRKKGIEMEELKKKKERNDFRNLWAEIQGEAKKGQQREDKRFKI